MLWREATGGRSGNATDQIDKIATANLLRLPWQQGINVVTHRPRRPIWDRHVSGLLPADALSRAWDLATAAGLQFVNRTIGPRR